MKMFTCTVIQRHLGERTGECERIVIAEKAVDARDILTTEFRRQGLVLGRDFVITLIEPEDAHVPPVIPNLQENW